MKHSKVALYSLAVGGAILTLSTVGYLSATTVSAAATDDSPTMIERLAEKLGLNSDQVETAFEEVHQEQAEARLDDAVANGDLTEEQKALLLQKQEEFRAQMQEINSESLTFEERQEARETLREEMQTWAEENGIPDEYCHGEPGGFGGGRMMGEGRGEGFGEGMHRGMF